MVTRDDHKHHDCGHSNVHMSSLDGHREQHGAHTRNNDRMDQHGVRRDLHGVRNLHGVRKDQHGVRSDLHDVSNLHDVLRMEHSVHKELHGESNKHHTQNGRMVRHDVHTSYEHQLGDCKGQIHGKLDQHSALQPRYSLPVILHLSLLPL